MVLVFGFVEFARASVLMLVELEGVGGGVVTGLEVAEVGVVVPEVGFVLLVGVVAEFGFMSVEGCDGDGVDVVVGEEGESVGDSAVVGVGAACC